MVSKRGKRGNPTPAAGKATSTASEISAGEPAAEPAAEPVFQQTQPGLSPPQFTLLVCISLAFTHILDIAKSVNTMREIIGHGVIAPENITEIPINATAYCAKHFQNTSEIIADTKEGIIAELGCTPSDLSILNLKYQTSLLRIALCSVTSLICWGDQALLKSWSFAYGIFILCMLCGCLVQQEYLKGGERFSLFAMIVLIITSNRTGRQKRLKFDVDEGMYNLVLFFLVVFMSYIISNHLIFGVEDFTNFAAEEITSGGKAMWYMVVIVEYSIVMIVSAFALMYFDEGKKRVSFLFFSRALLPYSVPDYPEPKLVHDS